MLEDEFDDFDIDGPTQKAAKPSPVMQPAKPISNAPKVPNKVKPAGRVMDEFDEFDFDGRSNATWTALRSCTSW